MAQIGNRSLKELTFGDFGIELMEVKLFECLSKVLEVLLLCFREDEYVVKINNDKVVCIGVEDIVYEALKCSRGSCEAKCHDCKFEVAELAIKPGFGNVFKCDAYLVISTIKVNFREVLSPL